jgi:hypothetical protein
VKFINHKDTENTKKENKKQKLTELELKGHLFSRLIDFLMINDLNNQDERLNPAL